MLIFRSLIFFIFLFSVVSLFLLSSDKLDKNYQSFKDNVSISIKSKDKILDMLKSSTGTISMPENEISHYKILDINKKEIALITPEYFVSKKEYGIGPEVNSLIYIEDNTFFNRDGIVNIKGFLRALYSTLRGNSQGGSGITQQLIKNKLTGDEQSISRKVKELLYTYNLEKKYSKLEIINLYLNNISYGKNIIGIQKAGEVYLGKKDLSIEDAFILNSMLKKPTYFLQNQEELKDRAIYYYKRYCSSNICENFSNGEKYMKQLSLNYKVENKRIGNPFIIDMIIKSQNNQNKSGEVIVNYIEQEDVGEINKKLDEITKKNCIKNKMCDLGVIILNKNGIIEYLYSGDYSKSQVNLLTNKLQPGSTLKPFIYSKYIDDYKISSEFSTVSNSSTCYGGWCPNNWNFSKGGNVTIQSAINLSYNLPVLHITKQMGFKDVLEKLISLNIFSDVNTPSTFILGTENIRFIDLANAYLTFLNDGFYNKFNLIYNGDIQKEKIYSEKTSKLMYKILLNTTDYKGKYGVKTGTTQDFKDHLVVILNENKVMIIWGGNRDGSKTTQGVYSFVKLKEVHEYLTKRFFEKKE